MTFAGTNANERIPFPPSKPSIPSHLQSSFPSRRVVSASSDDLSPKHDTLTGEGASTSLSVQEYSWAWGGFPQPSPIQGQFAPPVLKGKGDDTRPETAEDELILKRSRSVPPELEGSPHTIRSPLPRVDDDDNVPLQSFAHQTPGGYEDGGPFRPNGRMTARHDDQTKFQVWLDGNLADFELSLVQSQEVFHSADEAESARIFDQGIVDYSQLMTDEYLIQDERLVMRWTGKQYITRGKRSPLLDSLQQWTSAARGDQSSALPSQPTSPLSSPSQTEQEQASSLAEYELKRAESEPRELPARKSTSSGWVRWWSRSRDITISERPAFREAATLPLNHVGASSYRCLHSCSCFLQTLSKPHIPICPPPSASAPATTPVAIQSPTMQPVPDTVTMRKEKKFAKTLRLSSDQLVSHSDHAHSFHFIGLTAIAEPKSRRQHNHIFALYDRCSGLRSTHICLGFVGPSCCFGY